MNWGIKFPTLDFSQDTSKQQPTQNIPIEKKTMTWQENISISGLGM
jgi:hypothetical protein